jgi:hypothetical protein
VNLDAIRNKVFTIANVNSFTLNDQAAALLGLTPAETRQVQNVLDELHKRVSSYEHTNLKQVDPSELPAYFSQGSFIQQALGASPGTLSAYEIRAMTDDELSALQQWYLGGMAKAVGADRGQIILDKSMDNFPHTTTNASNALWLKPGVQRMIIISDYVDAKGVARSSWVDTYGAGGAGGTSGTRDLYPDDWADLLQAARANVRPQDPTLTPQEFSVRKNLRLIFECAETYMDLKRVAQVSYPQLVAAAGVMDDDGAEAGLQPLAPVVGENYDSLVVHQGDTSITLNVPGQGPATYEP